MKNIFIKIAEAAEPTKVAFTNPVSSKISSIPQLISTLIEAVTKLGAAIVVMFVIYSGFLFVKAQGDPGELEQAKKTFMWTIIGGVVLLGASALAAVIEKTATGLGVGLV